jgi:hypothetical protein
MILMERLKQTIQELTNWSSKYLTDKPAGDLLFRRIEAPSPKSNFATPKP